LEARAPSVITHYEDDPGKGLQGPLLFTNNALCFAQLNVAATRNPIYNIGFKLGSAVGGQSKRTNVVGEVDPAALKEIVDASSRLIVLPKEKITEIKYEDGVQVKIGNKSHYFKIEGNKKEASTRFESLVLGYLR
jgi:hypothetical protein